nr:MAG TPA: hypothetical protein [Caudoviricetes sp.]
MHIITYHFSSYKRTQKAYSVQFTLTKCLIISLLCSFSYILDLTPILLYIIIIKVLYNILFVIIKPLKYI